MYPGRDPYLLNAAMARMEESTWNLSFHEVNHIISVKVNDVGSSKFLNIQIEKEQEPYERYSGEFTDTYIEEITSKVFIIFI